jgi:hypothetical protein
MTNSLRIFFGISWSAMLLCGCGSESSEPQPDTAVETASADGDATFLVKGMMDRLTIY